MGTICPCGVQVNAFAKNQNIQIAGVQGTVYGNLTYMADVCVTSLANSTLSLRFEDTRMPSCYSFLFRSTNITNVTCQREGQNCIVTVTGTGKVGLKKHVPFVAVFKDQAASAANDVVQSFVIQGFFSQLGAIPVQQGSIVALGCQCV